MSARVNGIIRSRDPDALLSLSKEYSLQCIEDSYNGESHYLVSSLLKRFPFKSSEDLKQMAISKMLVAEQTCSSFNRDGWKALFIDGRPSHWLQDMRMFCAKVLPVFDWKDTVLAARHGPGADTDSHGAVSSYDKYVSWPYHVTAGARSYAVKLIQADKRWLGALEDSYRSKFDIPRYAILNWPVFWSTVLTVVDGNRVTTVPKDSQTDRPIAIEPRMNLMLQLGVDGVIRKRLKRWGIDLDSQLKNQEMSRVGSLCDAHADCPVTFDLSNASDTVSLRILKLVLPGTWYEYVCALRSPKGKLPNGETLRYSKVSSMGNGATFAIESLVFSAAIYAAVKQTYGSWRRDLVSIFGDDLIVPKSCARQTAMLLEHCGFTINHSKSFTHGDRRESCGTDWIAGRNVRPVFIDRMPEDSKDLFCDLNRLQRWAYLRNRDIPNTRQFIMRYIPRDQILFGPLDDNDFDSWIHSDDPVHMDWNSKWAWSYRVRTLESRPRFSNRANRFLFRKLMARLPIVNEERASFKSQRYVFDRRKAIIKDLRVGSGGSMFDVVKRGFVTYHAARRLPVWQLQYTDWRPGPQGPRIS